ncbi:MAG: acetyl-CoA carboxylase biotin carboxyl carrier protein [Magnetospirillum sp.]|jgi:acetyl-CoA carboxylase biotin carboxyl carrier protein|nr:acetyl-CoA carboxylase biotin carboxyl carrier protein [Magnetospirillum sp.]
MPTNKTPEFSPNLATVRRLAKLMAEEGLTELEFEDGKQRLRLGRGVVAAAAPAAPVAVAAPATAAPGAAVDAGGAPEGAVTSPMVGTCYLSPEPGAPAFVKAGDRVKEGQTLVIIEAMKVMNPIRSPRSGTVARILVENGSPVEYGEPLIVVLP